MAPKRAREPPSHGERAAGLLKKMRAANAAPSAPSTSAPRTEGDDDETLPLPRLIHALHTLGGLAVVDAIAAARALVVARCNTRGRCRRISAPELEQIGCGTSPGARDKIVQVLQTIGRARSEDEVMGITREEHESKRRQVRADADLRRSWGDVAPAPGRAPAALHPSSEEHSTEAQESFEFNPVLDESALRGRRIYVNRAPVMTAWCVVVLQHLGFSTHEALSLAQCYVSTTAAARARSLGRVHHGPDPVTISANQPHVELMGVKIPVICLRNGMYRGLHGGEVVSPMRAFDYLRRSMFQTLPMLMGALMLLGSSYADGPGGAEQLHKLAYGLYVEFRPETHGEWGKRAELLLDRILALRRGQPGAVGEPSEKQEKSPEDLNAAQTSESGDRSEGARAVSVKQEPELEPDPSDTARGSAPCKAEPETADGSVPEPRIKSERD